MPLFPANKTPLFPAAIQKAIKLKLDFSFELKCKDRKGLKQQMLQSNLQIRKKYLKNWKEFQSNKEKNKINQKPKNPILNSNEQ